MKSLYRKVKHNPVVKRGYKALFYTELGKAQIARFYQWITSDLAIILIFLNVNLGIVLTNSQTGLVIGVITSLFFIVGLFMKKSGLWDVDKEIQALKDPVAGQIYKAARFINSHADAFEEMAEIIKENKKLKEGELCRTKKQ